MWYVTSTGKSGAKGTTPTTPRDDKWRHRNKCNAVMAKPNKRTARQPHLVVHIVTVLLAYIVPTVASFSIFQPSGLSSQQITTLAQTRFNKPSNDDHPMDGRVAVVTGAAGGIGRQLCQVLHSLGTIVVALDRNETGLEMLSDSLQTRVVCIPTQQEDLNSVADAANTIRSNFNVVDLLINNAGLTYNDETCIPGNDNMKSAHGHDLAFTVNYLSHFLLVEKLMPCLQQADEGRIVHLTSSYHWKVDGSELVPTIDGGPVAYESDPVKMSNRHIARSYANTKLAQIWHSRSITGCESVCACPTWVATGIAGESKRSFLESLAFPVEGPGISSAINAMFRSRLELRDALNNGHSFVANSRILEYIPGKDLWGSEWLKDWRDDIVDFGGFVLLLGQRFTYEEFIIQRTSPESCRKDDIQAFRDWSLREVQSWL